MHSGKGLLFPNGCRSLHRLSFFLAYLCSIAGGLPPLGAQPTLAQPPGLYVRNGVLMRNGRPYHGIGANYQLLFARLVTNKDDSSTLENLAGLAKAGIPFVRFRANGHRAIGYKLYLEDRPEFFRRMDQVVHCAEGNGIGLIPSLFWHLGSVAELVGEPLSQLGNPNSKINAFLQQFTREMVVRYRGSPAIWGWEFGNETNLATDLPPRVTAQAAASLSSEELRVAHLIFAKTVRDLDPERIIDTGNSAPRRSAWHNAQGRFWEADREQQLATVLLRQNPKPFDVLSVHIYPKSQGLAPFGSETVAGFVSRYNAMAARARMPLFVGEFPTATRTQTDEFLAALVTNRVPLSAFWVFDYPQQDQMGNVNFRNERSFVIDLIAQANRRLQNQTDATAR
jgi:hypothetical protein